MARAAAAEMSFLGLLYQRTQNVEACGVCLASGHSRALQSNSGPAFPACGISLRGEPTFFGVPFKKSL